MKALKSERYREAMRDGTLWKYKWVVVRRPDYEQKNLLKELWNKLCSLFNS